MNVKREIDFIEEPLLAFGKGQKIESPKDGLYLFGPLEEKTRLSTLRIGIVATKGGLEHFQHWVDRIQGFIPALESSSPQHRPYPGFKEIFGVEFPAKHVCELEISDQDIDGSLLIGDRHVAIYKTVDLIANQISKYLDEEEVPVDVWFVVIPEKVFTYGRPQSKVPTDLRKEFEQKSSRKEAKELLTQPSLFEEAHDAAEPYYYEKNFHNQLKARLLEGNRRAVLQIVRETTLNPDAFLRDNGLPMRRLQDEATVAWNLSTTAYFKSGQRPWKLAEMRPRVCYVGLVYKVVENAAEGTACCGAQMFLDSGDGLVFKGAIGPWRTERYGEFHLDKENAKKLISIIVGAYAKSHGYYPSELFIHGKTSFNDQEWSGFQEAVPKETNLVGVKIRKSDGLKLYRPGKLPAIRGTAMYLSRRSGYLWTSGYVPFLRTYPGRETPVPLKIEVLRGDASLKTVMQDIMGLTKLNFNSCIFGDSRPVTLRFADSVGEILTAGPVQKDQPPLPFKHYI